MLYLGNVILSTSPTCFNNLHQETPTAIYYCTQKEFSLKMLNVPTSLLPRQGEVKMNTHLLSVVPDIVISCSLCCKWLSSRSIGAWFSWNSLIVYKSQVSFAKSRGHVLFISFWATQMYFLSWYHTWRHKNIRAFLSWRHKCSSSILSYPILSDITDACLSTTTSQINVCHPPVSKASQTLCLLWNAKSISSDNDATSIPFVFLL